MLSIDLKISTDGDALIIAKHTDREKYTCPKCRKDFSSPVLIAKHMMTCDHISKGPTIDITLEDPIEDGDGDLTMVDGDGDHIIDEEISIAEGSDK